MQPAHEVGIEAVAAGLQPEGVLRFALQVAHPVRNLRRQVEIARTLELFAALLQVADVPGATCCGEFTPDDGSSSECHSLSPD